MIHTADAHGAQQSWQRMLQRSALALGGALLASALVSWVAANWAVLTPLQKFSGAQGLLALLSLLTWLLAWRGQTTMHRHAAAVCGSLAGVAIGALLALVGQQYQTGADAWQLFFWWAVLLLPWLVTLHTVLLALLWSTVVNVMLGLLLRGGAWPFAPLSLMLLAVLVNAVLLSVQEGLRARLHDAWRIGPRMALAALLVWLTAAHVQYASKFTPLLGLGVLAAVAYGYAQRRFDLAMLSLGALYALIWVVLEYILLVRGGLAPFSLLGLVLILLAQVAATLAWFRRVHARHVDTAGDAQSVLDKNAITLSGIWFVSAFRTAALWLLAWLLVAFLFALLNPFLRLSASTASVLGVCTTGVGMLMFMVLHHPAGRETAAAVTAAGFTLICMAAMFSAGVGFAVLVLIVGAAVYAVVDHTALRFFCALMSAVCVLWLTDPVFWDDIANSALGGVALPNAAYAPLYLRLWLLAAGAVACLWVQWHRAGATLVPLAWALALTAQALAWTAPASWRMDAGLAAQLLRAGFVLLPAALLWGLWRRCAHGLTAAMRKAVLAALLAAGAAWLGAPGIALGLAWWLLGFDLARREWMALGALGLFGYLWRFYYDLDVSLLDKASLLAATALCLALCGWALASITRRNRPQQPPLPRAALRVLLGLPAGLALVLAVVNLDIARKETMLRDGARVVLELAPFDPRSLMQGDYMALNYAVNRAATAMFNQSNARPAPDSIFVLQADARGVHHLVAIQPDVEPRAQGQIAMRTRWRFRAPVIGVDSYFFPEGQGARFAQARYGEYRVSPSGQALLLRLLDANLQPL